MSDRRTEHVSPGEEDFRRPRRGGENEGRALGTATS